MMLDDALRPPRQSFLLGPSTVFCVAAHAPHPHTASAQHAVASKRAGIFATAYNESVHMHEQSQVPNAMYAR